MGNKESEHSAETPWWYTLSRTLIPVLSEPDPLERLSDLVPAPTSAPDFHPVVSLISYQYQHKIRLVFF